MVTVKHKLPKLCESSPMVFFLSHFGIQSIPSSSPPPQHLPHLFLPGHAKQTFNTVLPLPIALYAWSNARTALPHFLSLPVHLLVSPLKIPISLPFPHLQQFCPAFPCYLDLHIIPPPPLVSPQPPDYHVTLTFEKAEHEHRVLEGRTGLARQECERVQQRRRRWYGWWR